MLNISKDLFTSWNDAGVAYCHWKSNEHLLPGLDGNTDLDVLLSEEDRERGRSILSFLDFLECKSQYGSRYPGVEDWIGFDKVTGSLIHIHLHYALVTGHKGMKEYDLPWREEALQSRILNTEYGVYVMEPNLELVTLYTRIGLKADFKNLIRCRTGKFHFDKDTKREIDWLKDRVNMSKVESLAKKYYGSMSVSFLDIIKKETIDAKSFTKLREITERNFKSNRRIHFFVRLREVCFFIYRRYLLPIRQKSGTLITKKVPIKEKGLTVAFLGQDGAGKTTVTKNIIKWWKWKLDVQKVYLGSGENYSSWKKKLAKRIPGKKLFRYIRTLLTFSDTKDRMKKAYVNVRKAVDYSQKGGLVVYDRYPQMEYAGICDGPKIRKRLHDIFGKGFMYKIMLPLAKSEEKNIKRILNYSPDVVIKLILSPEESLRRKPEENYADVKKKHEIIRALTYDKSDIYTVDATMPFDEELIMIKTIIWQHIPK